MTRHLTSVYFALLTVGLLAFVVCSAVQDVRHPLGIVRTWYQVELVQVQGGGVVAVIQSEDGTNEIAATLQLK